MPHGDEPHEAIWRVQGSLLGCEEDAARSTTLEFDTTTEYLYERLAGICDGRIRLIRKARERNTLIVCNACLKQRSNEWVRGGDTVIDGAVVHTHILVSFPC